MKKIVLSLMTLSIALVLFSCGGNATKNGKEPQKLSGAGATFPFLFYNVLFEEYAHKSGNDVAYGAIGSGGGIRNLRDRIVDFAGSDAYLSYDEMKELPPVVHIPTCMGAVVVAYNLDGVKNLKLTGELIADIFAGEVQMWNDPRIAELNPEATLPSQAIIPVYRSDGSGTTFVFTDYLTKVSETWAGKFGTGKSVNFPYGQAARGNAGVSSIISHTQYTIGYLGSEYAFAQNIAYASIQNPQGEFIEPTTSSISAAASGDIPSDTRTSITNADAPGAYPISTFTWMIIYKEQNYSDRTKEQAEATLDLMQYILTDEAQALTSKVHYAPLPEKAKDYSRENLKSVTYNGVVLLK